MKTIKQILALLLAVCFGIALGQVIDFNTIDIEWLKSLYNLTDYIDVFISYFTD